MYNHNAVQDYQDEKIIIRDIADKFIWTIGVRYLIIVLGAILVFLSTRINNAMPLILQLIFFVAAYNIIAHVIYMLKRPRSLWGLISIGWIFQFLDLIAITFLIYISGWLESPFWFLYFVMIILAGFGMFSYYSFSVFVIAFSSALFYLGLLLALYLKILPIYGTDYALSPQELFFLIYNKAVFASLAFLLLAVTIYYFSNLLNDQRKELSSNNRKLLAILEKIKDVDRMKDEFISTASHELRTPLSVVRENVALVEDKIAGDITEKQKQLLSTALLNIDHLAKILDNLLDIAKIESHSLTLKREACNLAQLAHKAVDLLSNKARQKNISLEFKIPSAISVWVDVGQIVRVIINLLDNAIKYTPSGGKIALNANNYNDTIEFSISDTGCGIAKNDFSKVFERFVHIKKEENAPVKSTGLGLSICKSIIEMHGGRIWFTSELGKGSKFTFSLPKVTPHD
ncbi:MAG: HAMP domain-containing sensor histidine kinase [Candidatus Margulisbacteria bacterium]|nr:HAMP domain-containing sensor histidine kinase [Candidatus Margulisiibacteriota bacterium]